MSAKATQPTRVAIAGASGRMGRMLLEAVRKSSDLKLSGALDMAGSPAIGTDPYAFLGDASGVLTTSDLATGLAGADVLIDFTRPAATLAHLDACRCSGTKMVIGTTGFSDDERARIAAAATDIAIVHAANMSIGINVMLKLVALATRSLGPDFDIEVIESHHRDKVDAPSGTALWIGEQIAQARDVPLKDVAVFAREGHTGARPAGAIGFTAIRGGDIIGEHTALYAGNGERIEITHRSSSRVNYAAGSLRAARFVAGQSRGLFSMDDVLGLG